MYYFRLQYQRTKRIIRDFGIDPYVGMIIGTGLFISMSLIIFKKLTHPQYIYTSLSLLFAYTLSDKSRNDFLKITFQRRKYLYIRLIENLICSMPFFVFLLFKGQYAAAVSSVLLCSLSSFYNSTHKFNFVIPSPFSQKPYEFTTGFRRTFLILFILFLITAISIFNQNLNLGLFCLWSLFLVCTTFYSGQEPVFYVWIYAMSPKVFLKEKIKTALYFSFLLSIFIVIPLICFNPQYTFRVALVWLIGLLNMVLIVVGIYAKYPVRLNLIQQLKIIIVIVFPPFLLYAIPNLYLQSIRRLNAILK